MKEHHQFIFQPGRWIGEGTVSFSSSPEQMFFVTKWEVASEDEEGIRCVQEVKMEGDEEPVQNQFLLCNVRPTSFDIGLENETVGQVVGTGIIDSKTIAWEFRGEVGFQGYEVYERHKDGEYSFHAEYASPEQFRTVIDGHIHKQEE